MFCGLKEQISGLYEVLTCQDFGSEMHEYRGIISKVWDVEEVDDMRKLKRKIEMVDGFKFEFEGTEKEHQESEDLLAIGNAIQVYYFQEGSSLPQAESIHPVLTNFVVKKWSEILDEYNIGYDTMVQVSTDGPLRMEFLETKVQPQT